MVAMTLIKVQPPVTDEQISRAVNGYACSELSRDGLWTLVYNWMKKGHDKWHLLEAITDVLNIGTSQFGDEYTERVHQAMSFTPDPFAPY